MRGSPWHWRRLWLPLVVAAAATLAMVTGPTASHALDCDGIVLRGGCLFTATGGDTQDPNDGFAVTNADGAPLWDFVRERDLQAIGYPSASAGSTGPSRCKHFRRSSCSGTPAKAG